MVLFPPVGSDRPVPVVRPAALVGLLLLLLISGIQSSAQIVTCASFDRAGIVILLERLS